MSDELNSGLNSPEANDDDIIELVDENGETTLFEHLATLEYEGETYLALSDPQADEDSDDIEVFILKIDQDENGEDVYSVPDDDVADAVFQKLVDLTDEME